MNKREPTQKTAPKTVVSNEKVDRRAKALDEFRRVNHVWIETARIKGGLTVETLPWEDTDSDGRPFDYKILCPFRDRAGQTMEDETGYFVLADRTAFESEQILSLAFRLAESENVLDDRESCREAVYRAARAYERASWIMGPAILHAAAVFARSDLESFGDRLLNDAIDSERPQIEALVKRVFSKSGGRPRTPDGLAERVEQEKEKLHGSVKAPAREARERVAREFGVASEAAVKRAIAPSRRRK